MSHAVPPDRWWPPRTLDSREHDIADSDDYFQYHGGMIATVRALTGQAPAAYIGDNTCFDVKLRELDPGRGRLPGCSVRARANPRWMAAMRRHGYKGAFEMAVMVDDLFGYDVTAGVYGRLGCTSDSPRPTCWIGEVPKVHGPNRTRGRCTR